MLSQIGKTVHDYIDAVTELGYDVFDLRGGQIVSEPFPENNLVCLRGINPETVHWSS